MSISSGWIRKATFEELTEFLKQKNVWECFYTYKEQENGEPQRDKFKPSILSLALQRAFYPKTMVDKTGNGEIWYYDHPSATYKAGGKDYLAYVIKTIWGDEFERKIVESTVYDTKASTRLPRKDFVLEPIYIPVQDCILEVYLDNIWKIRKIPNTPELYVTNRLNISYDPSAKSQAWDTFLDLVFFNNDKPFIQEYCGTILWQRTVMLACVLVGPTETGKTTFTKVLWDIFEGDSGVNCVAIPIQNLEDKYERYRLYKTLVNIVNEFSNIAIKDSSNFKAIITGAPISARTLNQPSFGFKSPTKHLLTTNDLPHVKDDTESFYNKWQLISINKTRFGVDVPKIPNFELVLTGSDNSKSAILNWLLEGLLRYLNNTSKFSNLSDWQKTKEMWSQNADSVGTFMQADSGWVVWKQGEQIPKSVLQELYFTYCEANNLTAVSPRGFYNEMSRRYLSGDTPTLITTYKNDIQCYGGIGLVQSEQPEGISDER